MSKQREKVLVFAIFALVAAAIAFFGYLLYSRIAGKNAAPVIMCATDEIRVSVNAPKEELLIGVTAMDAEDGDLTASVFIESISPFVEKGKCTITYAVCDSGNKVAVVSRTLYYTDYHSPRFELTDDFIYSIGTSVTPLANIRAYDCIDGDITSRISMSAVDDGTITVMDSREVEFRVINSYGDVSTLRANIIVQEKPSQSTPEIALSAYLVYITKDQPFDPIDYVEYVTISRVRHTVDELGRANLSADTSAFDPAVPGTYTIPIYCENDSHVGSAVLYVIVEG